MGPRGRWEYLPDSPVPSDLVCNGPFIVMVVPRLPDSDLLMTSESGPGTCVSVPQDYEMSEDEFIYIINYMPPV